MPAVSVPAAAGACVQPGEFECDVSSAPQSPRKTWLKWLAVAVVAVLLLSVVQPQ